MSFPVQSHSKEILPGESVKSGILIGRGRLFLSYVDELPDGTTVVNKYTHVYYAPHKLIRKVLWATKAWVEKYPDTFTQILDVRAYENETMYVAEYAVGRTLADWLQNTSPNTLTKQQQVNIALSLAVAMKDYIAYYDYISQTCQTKTIPTISTRSIYVFENVSAPGEVQCKLSPSFNPFITLGTFDEYANHQDAFELAPERYHEQGITKASLMFGYGMMLYLLMTGKVPHANFSSVDNGVSLIDFIQKVMNGFIPILPDDIDPFFAGLIKSTWSLDKLERPKFDTVIDMLRAELALV